MVCGINQRVGQAYRMAKLDYIIKASIGGTCSTCRTFADSQEDNGHHEDHDAQDDSFQGREGAAY